MNKDTDIDLLVKYVIIIGGIIASITGIVTSIYYLNEMKFFSKFFLYFNPENLINNYFRSIYNIIRDSIMDTEKGERNIFQVLKKIGTVLLNMQNNMVTKDYLDERLTKMENRLMNNNINNNGNKQITLNNSDFPLNKDTVKYLKSR